MPPTRTSPSSRRFAEYTIISKAKASLTEKGSSAEGVNSGRERTVHQRKDEIGHFAGLPWLEVTGPVLFEREVRKYQRFSNWICLRILLRSARKEIIPGRKA